MINVVSRDEHGKTVVTNYAKGATWRLEDGNLRIFDEKQFEIATIRDGHWTKVHQA